MFFTSLILSASVVAQDEKDWTVEDYLRDLPEKYRTHSGDFQNEPTAETTIKDIRNGYLAYLSQAPHPDANFAPYPIFQMAIYKQSNGEPLVVVSNTVSDSVCTKHETFFLRKRGAVWQDVRAQVLPALSPQMFFAEAELGQKLEGLHRKFGQPIPPRKTFHTNLHFSPPREGTRMKVALDLCNYVPSELAVDLGPDFDFFNEKKEPIWLEWDKRKGVFSVARSSEE